VPNFQQEFLASCADDAKHLLELHWQEIAINKHKIKLNPHWEGVSGAREGKPVTHLHGAGKPKAGWLLCFNYRHEFAL
jgi:hypothetical protein